MVKLPKSRWWNATFPPLSPLPQFLPLPTFPFLSLPSSPSFPSPLILEVGPLYPGRGSAVSSPAGSGAELWWQQLYGNDFPKISVDHDDKTASPGGGATTLGGGKVSSGGGMLDTGGVMPFYPVPAEFNHWMFFDSQCSMKIKVHVYM